MKSYIIFYVPVGGTIVNSRFIINGQQRSIATVSMKSEVDCTKEQVFDCRLSLIALYNGSVNKQTAILTSSRPSQRWSLSTNAT